MKIILFEFYFRKTHLALNRMCLDVIRKHISYIVIFRQVRVLRSGNTKFSILPSISLNWTDSLVIVIIPVTQIHTQYCYYRRQLIHLYSPINKLTIWNIPTCEWMCGLYRIAESFENLLNHVAHTTHSSEEVWMCALFALDNKQ